MTRATFKVLFYIKRTKVLKDGTAPIFVRITVNRKRAEFGLQKSIEINRWDNNRGCAGGLTKKAKELNSYLDFVKSKLFSSKLELEEKGIDLSASHIKNKYLGIEEDSKNILEIFREHNTQAESLLDIDFAKGTIDRYNTCYRHTESFIHLNYGKKDLPLSEITPKFVKGFEVYLKVNRNCCNNTAIKYLKNFKKIIRIALANSWMKSDPFIHTKFRLDEVDMHYLNEKELNVLINKDFKIERLEQVKDTYLFCCFTGLAFIDVKTLGYQDIVDNNGQPWVKKKRQKTKNWCNIPLLTPAQKLIDKYKELPYCRQTGKVLPVLSNQKMNAYLKEIADLCGIDKKLSTHTARHTFATTVTLANQVSIEVVSKMLGHSSINMTKKYARVVDDLISRDMQKIYTKYEGIAIS